MTDYLERVVDIDDPHVTSSLDELHFWSSPFGRLLFDNLELVGGIDVLDLGCGTGFPLFELAHVHGTSCRFTGVDIWKSAMRRAARKLSVYQLENVHLVLGDGELLPFKNGAFDLIVSNLGLNNFADPRAAVGECARVARPGARIVLTTNVEGHMREFYEVYRRTLHELGKADHIERLNAQEAHRANHHVIGGWLQEAGFPVSRVVEESFHMRYLDGAAFLRHFLTVVGFLDGWRGVLEGDDEVAVFSALEENLNALARREGELRLTVPMLYVEGQRPWPG